MQEIALFSRKIYTAGTNFTRPLVVRVATIINSGMELVLPKKYTKSCMLKQMLARDLDAHKVANVAK